MIRHFLFAIYLRKKRDSAMLSQEGMA
uniref:Uncharacterized protein n=1 Tax=Arundo donax TaxID=35708 RepID=A0A0A8Z977_ARUDO